MRVQNINDTVITAPTVPQKSAESVASVAKSTLPSALDDAKQPSPEELQNSINQMAEDLKKSQINLDFSIDKSTKEVVVKVIDSSTGDVLTQFPSKHALAISELVANQRKGAFLNKTA